MTDLCAWLGMSGLTTSLLLETVLLFLGGGFVFKFVTTACQTCDLVLIVTFSPNFKAPLAFSPLLMFEKPFYKFLPIISYGSVAKILYRKSLHRYANSFYVVDLRNDVMTYIYNVCDVTSAGSSPLTGNG